MGSFVYAGLISPPNESTLRQIHILFEWEQEPNAVSYNLQVSNNQSFSDNIIDIEEVKTIYIDLENINWSNDYYWRVRPIYNNENYGSWIDTLYFSTIVILSSFLFYTGWAERNA